MKPSLISPDRRRLLLASAGLLTLGACATRGGRFAPPSVDYPFTLGVAAGDPQADGFVIWTRLAPQPLAGGGMPALAAEVDWEVADDENFREIRLAGRALAEPEWAHTLHIEIAGLDPDRWYYYRFRWGFAASPVGRARTAPAADAQLANLRFAYASCQHYENGYYAAYRHMVADQPDLILHLGDYIYESSTKEPVRKHEAGTPRTLEQYRNRHACYRLDRDLQAAHGACAWLFCWDDHDVVNDYAGVHAPDFSPAEQFLVRRAAAYRAYWEHLPLRLHARPAGPDMQLFQRSSFGNLLAFHVLDTRQYRDDQACPVPDNGGGRVVVDCAQLADPQRSMLGPVQEQWLLDGLARSDARWNVIAQSMLMAPLDQATGPDYGVWTDGWSGYAPARQRILDRLALAGTPNPVVIGGDIHSYVTSELALKAGGVPVATEFTGTSISSSGVPYERFVGMLAENPHIKFLDSRQRGYVLCNASNKRLDVRFRALADVRDPDSTISTLRRFAVEAGSARVLSA